MNEKELLKIAVIGTGNCGSMLVNDACNELGIDGIAINGSDRDLSLVSCKDVICFKTGDGNGTGKNRETAKRFFVDDSGLALDAKFTKVVESNDIIIVTTSTGGGYGSGASTELIELLTQLYPTKVVIAAGVLPFHDEQFEAFEGTKNWLKELAPLKVPYMLYSNDKYLGRTYPGIGKVTPNKAAKMVNEYFIKNIRVLQGDYIGRTMTGGIDERDMLAVVSVPGLLVIDSMEKLGTSDIIDNSLVNTIKDHIVNESAHVGMVDDKIIMASAMMYTLNEEFDDYKVTVRTDMKEVFGTHLKDTCNFSDDDGGSIALVVSGLTAPNDTIDKIIETAKDLGASINTRKASNSKLFAKESDNNVVGITAKQSFAEETQVVSSKEEFTKEELLKKFIERKTRS